MTSAYLHLIKMYQLVAIQNYAAEKENIENSLPCKKLSMKKVTRGYCCVCSSTENLRNIHHKYIYEDEIGDCVDMFASCFNVEIIDNEKQGEICETCVIALKDGAHFRRLVEASVQSQNEALAVDNYMATSSNAENDWLNTVGQEIKKHGNKTIFSNRIPKKPLNCIKPTLPRGLTVCPICNVEFDSHFSLVRHHTSHYHNYLCEICEKGYYSLNNFKRHTQLHSNRKHPCQLCTKVYSNKDALNQHVQIHHRKMKLYRCRKCPERFSASSTRQKHMFDKHGVDCRRFSCAQCGKIFFTIQHHNSHVKRTHLNLREYGCQQCDKSFYTARELKSHSLKHSDVPELPCQVVLCENTFA